MLRALMKEQMDHVNREMKILGKNQKVMIDMKNKNKNRKKPVTEMKKAFDCFISSLETLREDSLSWRISQ